MSNGAPPPPPSAVPPPSVPPSAPPPSYAPPASSASNSGWPTWLKVLLGCGCLTVLLVAAGFLLLGWGVKKGVETIEKNPAVLIDAMPGLEVVENDQDAETITIRNTQTGEVGTFDYSEVRQGRFKWKDAEGKEGSISTEQTEGGGFKITTGDGEMQLGGGTDLENVPSWVLLLPDAAKTESGMTLKNAGKASGMLTQTVETSAAEAADAVEEMLSNEGYTPDRSTMSFGPQTFYVIQAKDDERTLSYQVRDNEGSAVVTLTYEGPDA